MFCVCVCCVRATDGFNILTRKKKYLGLFKYNKHVVVSAIGLNYCEMLVQVSLSHLAPLFFVVANSSD